MSSNPRTLTIQRLLQRVTGGNAKDADGKGPKPADSGPDLHAAYATGRFQLTVQGPPCKAFYRTLPANVRDQTLHCRLIMNFRVPRAHADCYALLEILVVDFCRLAEAHFMAGRDNVNFSRTFSHEYTYATVNRLMTLRGQAIRALQNVD
jgi:integrase